MSQTRPETVPQTVVVTGATGEQALAISRQLTRAGHRVIGLTRSPERTSVIEATGSRAAVVTDDNLVDVVTGADAVVFTATLDYRPGAREQHAEQVASAVRRAGVRHIVYNPASDPQAFADRPVGRILLDIGEILRRSGACVTEVRPTIYINNLRQGWALQAIGSGALPYPVDVNTRISWLSHESLGDFVTAAVGTFSGTHRSYRVGGPEAVSTADLARVLSEASGRPVHAVEFPVDQFAGALSQMMGPDAAAQIPDIYRHLSAHPDTLVRDPAEWTELGVQPEPVEQWIRGQKW